MSCAWSLDKLIDQAVRLSGLFRKHMFGCFIEDQHGIDNRYAVGVDNITWECDYDRNAAEQLLRRRIEAMKAARELSRGVAVGAHPD